MHREVTSNVRGHSCRSGRARSAARARANVNASVRKCAYGTHRVTTIGPRMGGIAAGRRGRHGGGEPLCCLRATKTMRRHQAARDAPRRLCRSSYTQAPRCTHVYAPSSGDGGLKQTRRKEKQTRGRTGRHSPPPRTDTRRRIFVTKFQEAHQEAYSGSGGLIWPSLG